MPPKNTTKRQIFLDTETTGLDSKEHRIIEVACIEMENRHFTGRTLHYYVNPERDIDAGAQAVHGITRQFLADKPLFKNIAEELFDFINGAQLVIHNAPFDCAFLDREFANAKNNFGRIIDYCEILDTLPLARRLHPSQRNNLDALCKRYKVDNSQRQLHGALKDTQLLAEVYLHMTGGQMHFDVSLARRETVKENSKVFFSGNDTDQLIVIKANSTELTEHEAYLTWLREQGACVWEEG